MLLAPNINAFAAQLQCFYKVNDNELKRGENDIASPLAFYYLKFKIL